MCYVPLRDVVCATATSDTFYDKQKVVWIGTLLYSIVVDLT